MAYSDEEKQAFKEKDLRISRLATLRDCISRLGDFNELNERKQEVIEISEYLVNYVYNGLQNGVTKTVNWVKIAQDLTLEMPNRANIKILNLILNSYKTDYNLSVNPAHILNHIFTCFGRYPTSQESVKVVLKSLNESKV